MPRESVPIQAPGPVPMIPKMRSKLTERQAACIIQRCWRRHIVSLEKKGYDCFKMNQSILKNSDILIYPAKKKRTTKTFIDNFQSDEHKSLQILYKLH